MIRAIQIKALIALNLRKAEHAVRAATVSAPDTADSARQVLAIADDDIDLA
jgi:hypothetical protein